MSSSFFTQAGFRQIKRRALSKVFNRTQRVNTENNAVFSGDEIVDLIIIEIWEARAFGGIYKRKSTILKRTEGKENSTRYKCKSDSRLSDSHHVPRKRIFVHSVFTLLTYSGLVSRFEEKRSPPFSKPTAFSVKTIIARARGPSRLLMLSRAATRPIWTTGGTNKYETMTMLQCHNNAAIPHAKQVCI